MLYENGLHVTLRPFLLQLSFLFNLLPKFQSNYRNLLTKTISLGSATMRATLFWGCALSFFLQLFLSSQPLLCSVNFYFVQSSQFFPGKNFLPMPFLRICIKCLSCVLLQDGSYLNNYPFCYLTTPKTMSNLRVGLMPRRVVLLFFLTICPLYDVIFLFLEFRKTVIAEKVMFSYF